MAGLVLLWLNGSPSPNGRDSDTRRSPVEHGVQPSNADSGSESSDKAVNYQSPNVPTKQTTSDKQELKHAER